MMHLIQASTLTSFLAFSSGLLKTAEAQRGPVKLNATDLLGYQICTSDSDCVSANNGVCDCANGGDEVSVNKMFKREFEDLFPPSICTQLAPEIPCGIGAGNVCRNSQCVFVECADKPGASQCNGIKNMGKAKACYERFCGTVSSTKPVIEPVIEPSANTTEIKLPDHIPHAVRESLIANKKFDKDYLEIIQVCETDEDCVYANNGFCDCANGGESVAINVNELELFERVFDKWKPSCTKVMSELPCGFGGSAVCGADKLCKFNPCASPELLRVCEELDTDFEKMQCAKEKCAVE